MPIRSHSTLAEVKEQFSKMGAAITAAATISPTHQAHAITMPASDTSVDVITAGQPGQLLVLVAKGTGVGEINLRDSTTSGAATGANIATGPTTSSKIVLDAEDDSCALICDGTRWLVVSSFSAGADQE